MSSEVILNIEHLSVTFTTRRGTARAVNDVSLVLHKGEKLGLVGESGCGKSVTSKSIMRLLPPQTASLTGKIELRGEDILSLPEKKLNQIRGNRISMIFQEPMVSLNPLYTIGNQLREILHLHKNSTRNEAEKEVISMLREVGIPSPEIRAEQYPFELSGGMRQRIMIAMALLCRPDILIADEPTTALDVTIQAQILELLNSINQKFGTSIILITHDLGVVAENVDFVAVMYAGRIVEKASVKEIFRHPLHPYTQGLLRSIPTMERIEGELPSIPGTVPSIYHVHAGCAFADRCPFAFGLCREKLPPDMKKEKSIVKCWKYADEEGTTHG